MHLQRLIFFLLFLLPTGLFGQEICDNGIDDDNDGLADWKDTTDCPCGWVGDPDLQQMTIYYIPNAFSPDGDERNNVFKPIFSCGFDVLDYELIVYDRIGEVVFTARDHQESWDGTAAGMLLKPGTYSWTVRYRSSYTDEVRVLQGHVSLLR